MFIKYMIEANLFYIWVEFTLRELLVYLMMYVNYCCSWINPHLYFFHFRNTNTIETAKKTIWLCFIFFLNWTTHFKCQMLQQWINQICSLFSPPFQLLRLFVSSSVQCVRVFSQFIHLLLLFYICLYTQLALSIKTSEMVPLPLL